MNGKRMLTYAMLICGVALLASMVGGAAAAQELKPTEPQGLTPEESLGRSIFFDVNLSINQNQSCADCHGAEAGWTGPHEPINAQGTVYEGSISGHFGDRKPPARPTPR
ncbi:MAG: cytochrome c peroxidase [Caldilineaceae bacterium]